METWNYDVGMTPAPYLKQSNPQINSNHTYNYQC